MRPFAVRAGRRGAQSPLGYGEGSGEGWGVPSVARIASGGIWVRAGASVRVHASVMENRPKCRFLLGMRNTQSGNRGAVLLYRPFFGSKRVITVVIPFMILACEGVCIDATLKEFTINHSTFVRLAVAPDTIHTSFLIHI